MTSEATFVAPVTEGERDNSGGDNREDDDDSGEV